MRARDIAIAGCGVAGLACAILLRRQGARVVVYDKLERPSPLGSGLILQPVGLHALDALGVGDAIRALGAPIERLYGRVVPSQQVVLDVRYRALGADAPTGVAVHRGALFQVLYEAALGASVQIESGREIAAAADGHFQFAGGAESPRFDLLIDALGMRSKRRPNTTTRGANTNGCASGTFVSKIARQHVLKPYTKS
jgi:2-polyprenyl-6-methoxyphenol hydroxylase-like FAD-dependent oxidoreductase